MTSPQSLADFYREKLRQVPSSLNSSLGHFNVITLREFADTYARPIHYARKDYFKISLLTGRKKLTYADKLVVIERHALIFSNPLIPYTWDLLEAEQAGIFCIFTAAFFQQVGHLIHYPVFQPGQVPVFPLDDSQHQRLETLFLDMQQELHSDYAYKQDRLRNLAFELIHQGLKLSPARRVAPPEANADTRLTALFLELLARQFPLALAGRMALQTPASFATQLAVHPNHLNRALKNTTGKTTSQLLGERLAQEAAFLVQHTSWPLADIGWCLGFEDPSSFTHFFRKHFALAPRAFRQQQLV